MPSQARLDAPGTLHHVVARGIARRNILPGDDDYRDFLGRLEAVVHDARVLGDSAFVSVLPAEADWERG